MKKIILLILIPLSLFAQDSELPCNYKLVENNSILAGTCASPDGANKVISSSPADYNYLNNNGYCYTLNPILKDITLCYTLTAPGTSLNFNAGYNTTGCTGLNIVYARLYTTGTCSLVNSAAIGNVTGLITGTNYTWCISLKCTGPGPGFTTFCPYYIFSALPLEMGPLNAVLDGTEAYLSWDTYNEQNTGEFWIERSPDTSFYLIDKIPAKGYSTNTINYKYIDLNPLPDVSYYRVTEVDLDGKQFKSNIATINNKEYVFSYVEVYNMLGEIISNDPYSISNGIYLIKYYNKDRLVKVEKVIK